MNTTAQGETVAVVCGADDTRAATVRSFLHDRQLEAARWFEPCDVDDVDRAVRAGDIRCVVFARLDDFLAALWGDRIDFGTWAAAEIQLEIVEPAPANAATCARAVGARWCAWQRGRRHSRIVGGVVLSVVAIAVAFGLLLLA